MSTFTPNEPAQAGRSAAMTGRAVVIAGRVFTLAARGPAGSCTARRPTRVDGNLAAIQRARSEAKKRSFVPCPEMM